MKKLHYTWWFSILTVLLAGGCARLAVPVASSMIPGFTSAFFEECDLELAEASLPAELKLMEGLLKNDPGNAQVLSSLCMGFTGYAMLFVEDENPERASGLYLRAKTYGLRAMGILKVDSNRTLDYIKRMSPENIEMLFWTTMAWNAWVNLNLDKPAAIGESTLAVACLKRVLEIDADYYYGAPCVLMGSILAARPPMLGGNPDKARAYFEKAIRLTEGKFLLAPYYFARYYAVRIQDRKLFVKLIETIAKTNPHELKDACLINQAVKQKTAMLAEMEDELFF
ncbi:MAG: TRAP transporter TatT component family protein [Deltaproteobacteria bacterium]|jgi:tetratricopeptide (TPR) repeat protein|nr:TRAP transporter TatT component family protein [Deltaproteobacteria bacterium]